MLYGHLVFIIIRLNLVLNISFALSASIVFLFPPGKFGVVCEFLGILAQTNARSLCSTSTFTSH